MGTLKVKKLNKHILNTQKIVEERKEELSKCVNVLLKVGQVCDIDGERWGKDRTLQLFIDDNGNIKLARVL